MATVVQMAYSALVININTRYLQYLSLSVLINKPPTESGSREMDRQLHDSSFICFKKTSNTIGDDIEFERSNRAQETRSSFQILCKKTRHLSNLQGPHFGEHNQKVLKSLRFTCFWRKLKGAHTSCENRALRNVIVRLNVFESSLIAF
jgi:hypothetical protein